MKRDDYEELMGFSGTYKQDGTALVHFDDFDRSKGDMKILGCLVAASCASRSRCS